MIISTLNRFYGYVLWINIIYMAAILSIFSHLFLEDCCLFRLGKCVPGDFYIINLSEMVMPQSFVARSKAAVLKQNLAK